MSEPRMAILPLQALQPPSGSAAEWWKIGAAAAIGFLGSLVGFRTRLYALKRDVDDEARARKEHKDDVDKKLAALDGRIATSLESIQQAMSDRHSSEAATEARGEIKTREALNAIRKDNDSHHAENRDRLRGMRQQLIAMVQLSAKMARATAGIDPSEVDHMLGRFLMAEVERADQ
jgi:hypothetical protein